MSSRLFLVPAFAALLIAAGCGTPIPQYQLKDMPPETRLEDLLGRLVLDEKLDMLTGASWMDTPVNEKYRIPSIHMAHGSSGIADWNPPFAPAATPVQATAFPAGIAVAATWDPAMADKIGRGIALEAKALGRDQLLGPALDIKRTPLAGTTFESYGEDPVLTARIGASFIRGIQAEGVIATPKYLTLHAQEQARSILNVVAAERTMEEIYLPAMEAAVRDGGAWSVMAAANRVNGVWATENDRLLNEKLKRDWKFRGYVVSSWGATHSVAGVINGGTDLEMPGPEALTKWLGFLEKRPEGNPGFVGGFLQNDRVAPELSHGAIRSDAVDEMLRRRFRAMFATGMFDRKPVTPASRPAAVSTPQQLALARATAAESIVLLKNSGVLPLDPAKVHSIAVIGPNAATARTGGGGSTEVTPTASVTPLAGVQQRAGAPIRVEYALGVPMEGESGTRDIAAAAALAKRSDVAIVFAGTSAAIETEGVDRTTLSLPAGQDELIAAVTAANRNTIVVLISGSAVTMPHWSDSAAAILTAWFPGQEGGHAIADVLFGDVNPSGKLPLTFPRELSDSSAAAFPVGRDNTVDLGEGIFVGYRHFDARNIAPLYPFGHGLSYTKFDYGTLTVPPKIETGQKVPVQVSVRNSGARPGAEILQLYVSESKPKVPRPPQELKAFQRVELKPGEATSVNFELDQRALSYFDPDRHNWIAQPGEFEVRIGSSSRDIRARAKFELVVPPPPPPKQPPIGSLPPRQKK